MRAIGIPGQRHSDRLVQRFVAGKLGIPETDADLPTPPTTKTASTETPDPKTAGTHCPECGGAMSVKGNMERCACGYACATAAAVKSVGRKKLASETSVKEYYSKIYPDDYVSELSGKPDSGKAGEKVEYGTVPLEKPVGDVGVGVKASRVTARDILGFGEEQGDVPPAGKTEVPDKKPTPPDEGPNKAVNEAGDAKMMGEESANSVGGPNDIPKGEKPNGPVNEAGEVKVPDLGVPSGKKGKTVRGITCPKDGSVLNAMGQCPTCSAAGEQQDDAGTAQANQLISREVVAKFCPECAEEMKKAGIKAVRASFIAKAITDRAKQIRTASK